MLKYIIGKYPDTEMFFPVVFPEPIVHADVEESLPPKSVVFSAGFFVLLDSDCVQILERQSDSLGIGPRPEDKNIIELFLFHGLAGLDLFNHMMEHALEQGITDYPR